MFNKKLCKKCRNKINSKYEFCPYCGDPISENTEENWGMLGKDDNVNKQKQFSNSIFGGISGSIINKMLGGVMKMLEKEMKKEIKETPKLKTNFRLMINGKEINLDNLQNKLTNEKRQEIKEIPSKNLPQKNLKKFSTLPKQEPLTNIRRLGDNVIYEINIPGVESIKDISILKLEKSIEIKAITKDKAYSKIIPINLPITNYNLSKGKLILELGIKN